MAFDTGNGTTLAFTSGTFSASIISIEPGAKTREVLDASHLGTTTDAESLPGDLWKYDEWTVNYFVDTTAAEKTEPPTATDTLTITAPSQLPGAGGTWAGTGFVTSIQPPTFANDTLQQGSFSFKFDGYTGPVFTFEAAS
jgi:hypothetical protein